MTAMETSTEAVDLVMRSYKVLRIDEDHEIRPYFSDIRL